MGNYVLLLEVLSCVMRLNPLPWVPLRFPSHGPAAANVARLTYFDSQGLTGNYPSQVYNSSNNPWTNGNAALLPYIMQNPKTQTLFPLP